MKSFSHLLFIPLFCASFICNAQEILYSPSKQIRVLINVEKGRAYYSISSGHQPIIRPSSFSFEFSGLPAFGDELTIAGVERSSVDQTWKTVISTADSIRDHYNETRIILQETGGLHRKLTWIFRAFDDAVAFRYVFPGEIQKDSLHITSENTEFNFAANDSAWWIPPDEFAYESLYRHTPLDQINGANTPMTIETRSGFFLSLHEAALVDYSEMTLKKVPGKPFSFIAALWPEPGGVCAHVPAAFKTPWRYLLIGRRPGDLIESHVLQNLNAPCAIADLSWIKPLKFVGIWWGMHTGKYTWFAGSRHGATTARMKQYIDFAAGHHIGGVLAEGWNRGWETWASGVKVVQDFTNAYPDFDLDKVVRYAKENKVAFIAHHETGGNIPEYEKQLDSAFSLCRSSGIHYLKTGYAGPIIPAGYHHHGQFMVRHFQKVLEKAAGYQLSLDVHESIKPTGLDRTWPNLLTQEAARGNEWNATYKATPPYHSAILPFTRLLAGPYDYTPGIFRINHSPEKNKRLYCTLANQLALYVVIYSPMLMAADMIENYEHNRAFDFIEAVPASWDETRVITAHIGHYVSIARRKGEDWFIGTVGDERSYLLKLPLNFLDKGRTYIATIYGDADSTNWETNPGSVEIGQYRVRATDNIYAAISKAGGNAVMIKPATVENLQHISSIQDYNKAAFVKQVVFDKIRNYGDEQVIHLALKKPVVLINTYSELYPASGKNALTDGRRGSFNFSAGGWQGFLGVDLDAVIDLGKVTSIKQISAGFLYSPNDWIFYPSDVEFFVSRDGFNFQKMGADHMVTDQPADMTVVDKRDFIFAFSPTPARYVKVIAHSIKTCPSWHPGAGKEAWMFCDEIMVK